MNNFTTPESFEIIKKVIAAMQLLHESGKGWNQTIDRLTYFAKKLLDHYSPASSLALKPKDLTQEAIASFLEARRKWTPPHGLDWECPEDVSKAFTSHMKHVVLSICRNELRGNMILVESGLKADDNADRFLDYLKDPGNEKFSLAKVSEDHYFKMFEGDAVALRVLEVVFKMKLYSNAAIAAQLQMNPSVVRNAKRRIERKLTPPGSISI